MEKELISVIVPIYNVEKYLRRCIESIINQTYTNLEIILVDDGSTDNSAPICDEYTEKDKRIKAIHKQNGGVSQARNVGIESATGQFIAFVDSDDYIENEMIFRLKHNIENCDLSVCGYQKVFQNDVVEKSEIKTDIEVTNQDFKNSLFYNGELKYNYQGYMVNKLFKSEIIKNNNIRVNEKIAYNEDRLFVYTYLNNCQGNVYISNYIGYIYFQREDSAMLQKTYKKQMYTEFVAFDIMSETARMNREKQIDDIIRVEYVINALNIYIRYYDNSNEEIKNYKKMTLKYIKQVLFSSNVKIKVKYIIIKRYLKTIFV